MTDSLIVSSPPVLKAGDAIKFCYSDSPPDFDSLYQMAIFTHKSLGIPIPDDLEAQTRKIITDWKPTKPPDWMDPNKTYYISKEKPNE